MLDLNKPLQVRSTHPATLDPVYAVRVLATDLPGRYPVAVAIEGMYLPFDPVFQFDLDGIAYNRLAHLNVDEAPIYWRLENVPESPAPPRDVFVNIYRTDDGGCACGLPYANQNAAAWGATEDRLGMIKITRQGDKVTKVELLDAGA